MQAAPIAKLAADSVEDQIETANLNQAVVAFGVTTDKISLLSGDPQLTIWHEHLHAHVDSDDLLAFALARKTERLQEKQPETGAVASSGNS